MTGLEIISGIIDFEHCTSVDRYYEKGRHLLNCEVNSTIEGAIDAGVKKVW